jgi:hypothetical protein
MEKFLGHPVVQGIFITVIGSLVIGLMTGFIKWLKAQFVLLLRRVEMVHIELKATDYAIEKGMGNGYTKARREKMSELIEKSKYVNADDFVNGGS